MRSTNHYKLLFSASTDSGLTCNVYETHESCNVNLLMFDISGELYAKLPGIALSEAMDQIKKQVIADFDEHH